MRVTGPIVGTAGHVDHGKTSLVRALTGTDLDALPEEQERGITIALGFVGHDIEGRTVAFVDVPGHERLVRTMVAGATGMDAVLLCVSAVDGVMPQTVEHLQICHSLGVPDGAVVLTMADLVDEELLELAASDVADAVAGTFLEGKPVIPFSAITGRGGDELREVIAAFQATTRSTEGPFRLPVDRVFSRPGFGTIVSGTVWSGSVTADRPLLLLPSGERVRVRGLQVHGEPVERGVAGQRLAVNLGGLDREEVGRGVTLASEALPTSRVVDVKLRGLRDESELCDGDAVRVLLGTTEALGRAHLASERELLHDGATLYAQLRLDSPLTCLPGDRFIVRRPSPETTLAGGVVLDPWAPRMRRRDRQGWGGQLRRIDQGDLSVLLDRADEVGLDAQQARLRGVAHLARSLGDRMFAPAVVGRLEGRLLDLLASYHMENPLSLGANRRELHRGGLRHLSDRVFDALVSRIADAGMATVNGPLIHLNGFTVTLDPAQEDLRASILRTVTASGLEGAKPEALTEQQPGPETLALLRLLAVDNEAILVKGLGWIATAAIDALVADVRAWFRAHRSLDAQSFKDLTGLSRRAAIPLLEWMDEAGITVRSGDTRSLRP